jgi:hypothetical protein
VRINGLGRVFERVQRKVFPVLDHGLVLEQLCTFARSDLGDSALSGRTTDLVDVFAE